jgi:acetyl esterase/lipase
VHLKFSVLAVSVLMIFTGCQSTQTGSKIIAGAFNASTQVQKKFIDIHAPKDVIVTENIQYLENPNLHFDLYQPKNIAEIGARPTIVWVHGGGWISGSKDHARGYFKRLADEGYNVISVEYNFAPDQIYPQQLKQIDASLQFISNNAQKFKVDANQLYLAGDSAGANMVSHYASLLTNPNYATQSKLGLSIKPEQVKGLILHCGIYDLESFISTAPDEIKLLEWGINNLVQAYTGGKKDDPEFLASISPAQHLTKNYPAVFISGGNKDFLTESQSVPFVKELKKYNIPVTEAFYPDSKELLVHEYQFMMSKKASQETFVKTVDFINKTSD